jgi:RNA polymerase sigma-70 factor (ECF subfamily)
MESGPGDDELMLRYRAGDAVAFEALYRRHRAPLYRFVLRQLGDAAAAEEVFQDVWMRVIDARGRYEARARFGSWLYAIAHNRLMDAYRAAGRAQLVGQDEAERALESLPAGELPAHVWLDRKRAAERLFAALGRLPEAQREAFLLQQEGELSVEEIAQVTGVSRETTKSRLRYAVAKLRESLRRDE